MNEISYDASLVVLQNGMRKGIEWFNKRKGQEISWPSPSPVSGFPHLVSSAKAIYKPNSKVNPADVAFSIRQNIKSAYNDKEPFFRSDGSWVYQYHQEGDSQDSYVNRALTRNIVTRSPIAVLIQTKSKPNSKYMVLGVGMVVAYDKGFFYVEGFSNDGIANLDVSKTLEFVRNCQFDEVSKNTLKAFQIPDNEIIVSSKISAKSNSIEYMNEFKSRLLVQYSNKCAISQTGVVETLEVFSFVANRNRSNIRSSNSFIVRADICNLLFSWCMSIDPKTRKVVISEQLVGSEYEVFQNVKLMDPIDESNRALESVLKAHYSIFKKIEIAKKVSKRKFIVQKGSAEIERSSEYVRLPLSTKVKGQERVAFRSGLNWGQRPKRDPNQAYLPIPSDVQKSGFFPPKGVAFSIECDDGAVFRCVIAQAAGKAIETPEDNALLGRYFRARLGVDLGDPVALWHLTEYGRTAVEISKVGKLKYYLDFSKLI